jgi:hypothetical protein
MVRNVIEGDKMRSYQYCIALFRFNILLSNHNNQQLHMRNTRMIWHNFFSLQNECLAVQCTHRVLPKGTPSNIALTQIFIVGSLTD